MSSNFRIYPLFELSMCKKEVAFMLFNVYPCITFKTDAISVIFDPIGIDPARCGHIDVIVITHEHMDHFNETLVRKLQQENNAFVLTTPFIASRLYAGGGASGRKRKEAEAEDKEKEKMMIKDMKAGDSFCVKDTLFFAKSSAHPAIQPLSFIIKTHCTTLYHPDDSKPFEGMNTIREKYKPDIMLYTGTSVRNMIEIAEKIRPNEVVSYADPRFEKVRLGGVKVKTLKPFEIYQITNKF